MTLRKVTVNTRWTDDGFVVQELIDDRFGLRNIAEGIAHFVLDTHEDGVRRALVALGWVEPMSQARAWHVMKHEMPKHVCISLSGDSVELSGTFTRKQLLAVFSLMAKDKP